MGNTPLSELLATLRAFGVQEYVIDGAGLMRLAFFPSAAPAPAENALPTAGFGHNDAALPANVTPEESAAVDAVRKLNGLLRGQERE